MEGLGTSSSRNGESTVPSGSASGKPQRCHKCSQTFNKGILLMNHWQTAHGYKFPKICRICDIPFLEMGQLNKHKKEVHGSTCPECGKEFKGATKLENHLRVNHGTQLEYPCKVCDFIASRKVDLVRHLQKHEVESPEIGKLIFACPICSLAFFDENECLDHEKIHDKPNKNVGGERLSKGGGNSAGNTETLNVISKEVQGSACPDCGQEFKGAKKLEEHMRIIHGLEPAYPCTVCSHISNKMNELIRHLREHESKDPGLKLVFSCGFCHQPFINEEDCRSHEEIHNNPVTCEYCNVEFPRNSALQKHLREDHPAQNLKRKAEKASARIEEAKQRRRV